MDKDVTEKEKPAADKKFVTFGQNAHKWGTYITIDWFWNYLSGMAFATLGKYTAVGRTLWQRPVTAAARVICRDVLQVSKAGLEASVGNTVAFFSVIAGGAIFTIPPLTWAENKKNRKAAVQWLDKLYYGKDKVEHDPRFAEAYDEMDHQKKQGALAGNLSRYVSLAPLLAAVMIERPREFTKPYFDWVEKYSGKIYNAVGLNPKFLYEKLKLSGTKFELSNVKPAFDELHPFQKLLSPQEKEWNWLHNNSAVDFGLEPWYALFHMITFRAFSQWGSKPDKEKKSATAHSADIATESTPPVHTKKDDRPALTINHITREEHLANVAQVNQISAT